MSQSDFYARAVASSPSDPSLEGGASGYFSAPLPDLDPHLFTGETLDPQARAYILRTLYNELTGLGLNHPAQWVSIWLAGSGVSYQWAADRGNGDLDVIFGVDMSTLVRANEDWAGYSDQQFAAWVNEQLRSDLWPRTAQHTINGQTYEVTFYLNPDVGRNIERIRPYAAYDVRKNGWTVHPSSMGARQVPSAWYDAAEGDVRNTQELASRWADAHYRLGNTRPGDQQWTNIGSELRLISQQAEAMFDDIHGGRHEAFGEQGHGYHDWHNFRWQYAKQRGVVNGLQGILTAKHNGERAFSDEMYGGPIAPAHEALERAQMLSQHRPGLPV